MRKPTDGLLYAKPSTLRPGSAQHSSFLPVSDRQAETKKLRTLIVSRQNRPVLGRTLTDAPTAMKIDSVANSGKITVVLSDQEYHAIAASLRTSASGRSRRSYEYDHHYGLSLLGMKALSAKFDAASPKAFSVSSAKVRTRPDSPSKRKPQG
jgi:hypothetical protein